MMGLANRKPDTRSRQLPSKLTIEDMEFMRDNVWPKSSSWIIYNQFIDTMRENERYKAALDCIASWDEGDTVKGSFDEPGSAQVARDALHPSKTSGTK